MTPTANLTETQQHILDCIRRWLARRRFAPTIREIAKATGITSTSVVDYNLKGLEEALHRPGLDGADCNVVPNKSRTSPRWCYTDQGWTEQTATWDRWVGLTSSR